jgi:hypothetical protein
MNVIRIEFAPALMTREIAAFYISKSLRELDVLREQKEITPVGDGRRVMYRKSELESWIDNLKERSTSREK